MTTNRGTPKFYGISRWNKDFFDVVWSGVNYAGQPETYAYERYTINQIKSYAKQYPERWQSVLDDIAFSIL